MTAILWLLTAFSLLRLHGSIDSCYGALCSGHTVCTFLFFAVSVIVPCKTVCYFLDIVPEGGGDHFHVETFLPEGILQLYASGEAMRKISLKYCPSLIESCD